MQSGQRSEVFGIFRGMDVFLRDSSYLSPIIGVLRRTLVKNLRMYGHYAKEMKGKYVRPEGHHTVTDLHPQDATASLLERVFPSPVGLVVNSSTKDKVNKYLTPKNIAAIFCLAYIENENNLPEIYMKSKDDIVLCYYDEAEVIQYQQDPQAKYISKAKSKDFKEIKTNKAVLSVMQIFLDDKLFNKISKLSTTNQRNKCQPVDMLRIEHAREFAQLIVTAYQDNVQNNCMLHGYPENVVNLILLVYMWEKNKTCKANFQPYFIGLEKLKIVNQEKYSKIIWTGPDSAYTYVDYQAHQDITNYWERYALEQTGDVLFKSEFPESIDFGTSQYDLGAEKRMYSDCGETLLRNLFIILLYDRKTKTIDVSRLTRLNELHGFDISKALINYFTIFDEKLESLDSPFARYAWTKVVGYLNQRTDKFKVRYLHPSPEEGCCGIDAGLENIMTVIIKLFNYHDNFNINMSTKKACLDNLETLFTIFAKVVNPEEYIKQVVLRNHDNTQVDVNISGHVSDNGWTGISLNIEFNNANPYQDSFELDFDRRHFDFFKVYISQNPLNPKTWDMMPLNVTILGIYSMRHSSIGNRLQILEIILRVRKHISADAFSCLLDSYLDQTGIYFSGWQNRDTTNKVFQSLIEHTDHDYIFNLSIPELIVELILYLADSHCPLRKASVILLDILKRQDNLINILTNVIQYCDNDQLKTLVKIGVESFFVKAGVTIPEVMAKCNNSKITKSLKYFGLDIRRCFRNPLAVAVENHSKEMVAYFIPQINDIMMIEIGGLNLIEYMINTLVTFNKHSDYSYHYLRGLDFTSRFYNLIEIIDALLKNGCNIDVNCITKSITDLQSLRIKNKQSDSSPLTEKVLSYLISLHEMKVQNSFHERSRGVTLFSSVSHKDDFSQTPRKSN